MTANSSLNDICWHCMAWSWCVGLYKSQSVVVFERDIDIGCGLICMRVQVCGHWHVLG